ncbi:Rpn family recombination-promoting nuclease/putative transposase [Virgibacillus kimchii]
MELVTPYYQRASNYTAMISVKENRNEYLKGKPRLRLLKRISLKKLMDLKVDYAFKQFFGNEKNKDITVVFLNAILQKTERNRIKDILFENVEFGREYVDDKQSRLDLLVKTEDDKLVNVEIQFTNQYNMVKRSLYYWSKVYTEPLQKGMGYTELRPIIAINILNFDLFEQTERFHTSYHLYEDEEQFKLTNVMEFHFLEMGKLIKHWKEDRLDPWNNALAKWLLLLGMVDSRNGKVYEDIYQELEEIALEDESLRDVFQNWEELSMEQEQRQYYDARLRRIMDEEAAKREAELRIQEAERKAEQQKAESIARRLLEKGMEIENVADSTGLAKQKVVDMQRDMQK